MKIPAAETDIIDRGYRDTFFPAESVELTPCGHKGLKTKFKILQTVEETLFANRRTKEKKLSKQ
jgi:hypothetical protein